MMLSLACNASMYSIPHLAASRGAREIDGHKSTIGKGVASSAIVGAMKGVGVTLGISEKTRRRMDRCSEEPAMKNHKLIRALE